MGTLYWSIVAVLLGGCIGSFLNVVIYRWPLGLSIRRPARSFCPACGNSIAWHDNIPVVSYVLLKARCRRCAAPISLQYPVVELAAALAFLMIYDAFFVANLRAGVGESPTDSILLAAHWALLAGLIVLTVMDLEAYMVDIRVTWVVSLAGVLGHLFWTPAGSERWIRPGAVQAGTVMAAVAGFAIGAGLLLRRRPDEPVEDDGPIGSTPSIEHVPPSTLAVALPSRRWLWLVLPVGIVIAYLVAMQMAEPPVPTPSVPGADDFAPARFKWDAGMLRLALGMLALFAGLTVAASRPQAESDAEILEAIDAEAPDARRMALWELKLLTPAIVLGGLAMVVLVTRPAAHDAFGRWLYWQAWGDWRPIWGLSTGLAGWILGGAIGWLARILFTLLFGKEALGMGDVHILAAAGAVAGWPVALMGFFLGAMLALAGMMVIRLRRQSRALPYGPWLGLGFLLAAMFQDRILDYLGIHRLFE